MTDVLMAFVEMTQLTNIHRCVTSTTLTNAGYHWKKAQSNSRKKAPQMEPPFLIKITETDAKF